MKRVRTGRGWFVARALAAPWLGAVALVVGVAMHVVTATAAALAEAAPAAAQRQRLAAHLVADDAALAAFGRRASRLEDALPGVAVDVRREGTGLFVRVAAAGEERWFGAEVLSGAPPAALSRPLTVGGGSAATAPDAHVDPDLARSAPRGDRGTPCAVAAGLVVRDPAIALQRLTAGTDREDFVFAAGADLGRAGGLVAVPGHLWLESGGVPRRVRASRDVVVLVRGNVYLGRSLRVEGGGRLVLAAVADGGARPFVDVDGDGRRGAADRALGEAADAGPIEGAGNLIVLAGDVPLACDAALWADGCLHLRRSLQCEGPVALVHGVHPLVVGAALAARGRWRFHGERDAVAGFPATGGVRPGFLRSCPPPADARPEKVPLYLSGPLR